MTDNHPFRAVGLALLLVLSAGGAAVAAPPGGGTAPAVPEQVPPPRPRGATGGGTALRGRFADPQTECPTDPRDADVPRKKRLVDELAPTLDAYASPNRTTQGTLAADRTVAARTQGRAPTVARWLAASDVRLARQAVADAEQARERLREADAVDDPDAVGSHLADARTSLSKGDLYEAVNNPVRVERRAGYRHRRRHRRQGPHRGVVPRRHRRRRHGGRGRAVAVRRLTVALDVLVPVVTSTGRAAASPPTMRAGFDRLTTSRNSQTGTREAPAFLAPEAGSRGPTRTPSEGDVSTYIMNSLSESG